MRQVVERIARARHTPMQELGAVQARRAYAMGSQTLELPALALAQGTEQAIVARDGTPLRARLYWPSPSTERVTAAVAPLPVVLYLHGGGFTIGSVETHDILCRRMASLSGAAVVSLDYRLAPERRFPCAVHDAFDALCWLGSQGHEWGLDGRRLAVAGDSAGGTLAAVAAIQARDAGIALAAQVLIYPGTTAHQDTESHHFYATGPVLNKPLIDWFFRQYIDWDERTDWRFAPLLAPELEAVAPALLVLAECDPLVDEGLAYADRLRLAGVDVELELYRGVAHEFIKMGHALPEAMQAHRAIAAWLQRAFSL